MSTSMVVKGGPWLVAAGVIALLAISISAETARTPVPAEQVSVDGSPFGVFYGLTPARGRPTTQYLRELGAHWTRQTLDWQTVEPKRGDFRWGLVDATVELVDSSQRAGYPINILVTIRARAQWAAGGRVARNREATRPPKNLQDYYRFVNAAVKRARGRVKYWQIENEVQYDVFWKGTPEQYLDLLRTGYRAVKDADPSAQVVLAGIGDVAWLTPMLRDEVLVGKGEQAMAQFDEWAAGNNSPQAKQRPADPQQLLRGVRRYDKMSNFTHRLLQADAARSFDVIDLHTYHPYTLVPAGVRWAQAVMARQGYSKPIWITETSGPNYPEMWPDQKEGERRQAEEVVKRYVLAIAAGAERVFWYVLQTPAHQAQGKWSHTGLLRPDGSKRPAFSTLGLMISRLDGAREVRTLSAGGGAQVFDFVRPQGSVFVAWADRGATARIAVGPGQAEITDALGNRTTRDTKEAELELTLSSLPVFVRRSATTQGRASAGPSGASGDPEAQTRSASAGCGSPRSSARSSLASVSSLTAAGR
ncbi:MAG: hypothetical protein ACE149_09165 [Armatimonadota bacterium]